MINLRKKLRVHIIWVFYFNMIYYIHKHDSSLANLIKRQRLLPFMLIVGLSNSECRLAFWVFNYRCSHVSLGWFWSNSDSILSKLIGMIRFGFHNFLWNPTQPNSFMNDLVWFGSTDCPFKFYLFFLRTTILHHDSSKYSIQLT